MRIYIFQPTVAHIYIFQPKVEHCFRKNNNKEKKEKKKIQYLIYKLYITCNLTVSFSNCITFFNINVTTYWVRRW